MFPAPREVDRELYTLLRTTHWNHQNRFRPLTRWIGCFTLGLEKNIDVSIYAFPAPLEVDRYLYGRFREEQYHINPFPAPREVDRLFYLRFRKEY